jgi:hypothetical protein
MLWDLEPESRSWHSARPSGRGLLITLGPVFLRGDGRQAFEPAAQIIRENEGTAPALHGTKLTRSNRLVDGRSTSVRGLAGFTDVESKLFCEHGPHHFASNTPTTVAVLAGEDVVLLGGGFKKVGVT